MSIDDLYKSNSSWIKADDLKGKSVKVIIEKVEVEEVGGDHKAVVYFEGKEKSLVLNATNARCLSAGFGDDEQKWRGNEIIMFPTTTEYSGKTVPCIRVRIDAPMAEDDDAVPF